MADKEPKESHPSPDQETMPVPRVSNAAPAGGTLRMETADLLHFLQGQKCYGSLLIIAGNAADIGTHIVIDNKVILGRESAELLLHDGGISRSHALVESRANSFILLDLGSTNGTSVNGVRLQGEHTLQEGDKIILGQSVVVFRMVDETEASYLKQVEHLVGTDELTGLMSKHRFDAAFKESFHVAKITSQPFCAIMMDMDGLKAINDRHGHYAGASTIQKVGGIIDRLIAGRGEACRFGGDEFSAFLSGINLQAGVAFSEEVRQEVERLGPYQGQKDLPISISIGVAILANDTHDMAALQARADQALYRAKRQGKNRVCV